MQKVSLCTFYYYICFIILKATNEQRYEPIKVKTLVGHIICSSGSQIMSSFGEIFKNILTNLYIILGPAAIDIKSTSAITAVNQHDRTSYKNIVKMSIKLLSEH